MERKSFTQIRRFFYAELPTDVIFDLTLVSCFDFETLLLPIYSKLAVAHNWINKISQNFEKLLFKKKI